MRIRTAAAAVLVFVATACPGETPPGPNVQGAEPVRGGTLRVVLAEDPVALDPHRAAMPAAWFFARALHRGLLAYPDAPYPAGARPVVDVARSYSVSRDRRRLSFELRDVRFGAPASRPMVARDVVASIERVLRADVGIARHLWIIDGAERFARGRAGNVRGLRAHEGRVTVTMRRPVNDLPWVLAHPQVAILPAETPRGALPATRFAGLGPYRIERYQPERRIRLARNGSWADDLVRGAYVDRIDARLGVRPATAARRVAAGRADLVVDPGPPDLERASLPEGARVTRVATGCVRYVFTDRRVGPFGRASVRAAVVIALQRAQHPDAGRDDLSVLRALPPTSFGHAQSLQAPAAGRLARDARDARGISATMVVGDSPRDRTEAAAVRRALDAAGLRITVRHVPAATLYPLYYDAPVPRVGIGIRTWCADWPGLSGRNVWHAIAGLPATPASLRERTGPCAIGAQEIRALRQAATSVVDRASERWSEAERALALRCGFPVLAWPEEEVVHAPTLGGLLGGPMFPRGDPTRLWVSGR